MVSATTAAVGHVSPIYQILHHMAGAALDSYLYAVGGQFEANELTGNSDLVHRYDPVSDVWIQVASLPVEIGHITASTFTTGERTFVVTEVDAELDVYRYRIHVRSANRYVDAASAGRGRCSITDQR